MELSGIPTTVVDTETFWGHVLSCQVFWMYGKVGGGCSNSLQKFSGDTNSNIGILEILFWLVSLQRVREEWWSCNSGWWVQQSWLWQGVDLTHPLHCFLSSYFCHPESNWWDPELWALLFAGKESQSKFYPDLLGNLFLRKKISGENEQ